MGKRKAEKPKKREEKKEDLLAALETMLKIRHFEEKVFELLGRDLIKGASHVYVGEEAVAVGAIAGIRPDDYITSTHRGHGHCLAKGGDLKKMMAELCGRVTGYCKGRGGSMHIADVEAGNLGATGIVGSNIPVATGAALSVQIRKTKQVVLCFFGDGASNTGSFHESLNMAATWKLPVIYLCENNLYGMSSAVDRVFPHKDIAVRGQAYAMPAEIVDGMDFFAVRDAVSRAAERARRGEGPTLLEAKTYRYFGHSRSDPRVYRTREEEKAWRAKDPIERFEKELEKLGFLEKEDFQKLDEAISQEVEEAAEYAISSPWPKIDTLTDDVYVPRKD